jgi:Lipase (class 3)
MPAASSGSDHWEGVISVDVWLQCGSKDVHALSGGAVAQLCALRLLQQLPASEARNVNVIAFASPAVGNQALARAVQQAGWQDNFKSFLMPGMVA